MADKLSNEVILEQLKNGFANFELVSSPVPSISIPNSQPCPTAFLEYNSHRFFAKIGPPLGIGSPAMRKVERYSIQRVAGDGRCLFRALLRPRNKQKGKRPPWAPVSPSPTKKYRFEDDASVKVKGMAFNKAISLNPREERENADELRMAVRDVICENDKERHQYEEALVAITVEESLKRYCQRIERPDFWGGESELLVLSKLCRQPIVVYIPEHEHAKGGWGSGFIPIAEYGAEFGKGLIKERARKVVRLLYSGKNHYDLLV